MDLGEGRLHYSKLDEMFEARESLQHSRPVTVNQVTGLVTQIIIQIQCPPISIVTRQGKITLK